MKRPDMPAAVMAMDLVFMVTAIAEVSATSWSPEVNTLRMWGVTADGQSIQLDVLGHHNYILLPVPIGMLEDPIMPRHMERILEDRIQQNLKYGRTRAIRSVSFTTGRSIKGYKQPEQQFYRVEFFNSWDVRSTLKSLVTEGNGLEVRSGVFLRNPYEVVDHEMQFLIDSRIRMASWLRVPARKFRTAYGARGRTSCNLYASCDWRSLEMLDDRSDIAPLRYLSFDIEVKGGRLDANKREIFPQPSHDRVITIGNYLYSYDKGDEPLHKIVFQLGTCSQGKIDGEVRWFNDEADLLSSWCEYVHDVDPDFLESYNGTQFDLPYIIERCKEIGVDQALGRDGQRARARIDRGGTKHTAGRAEYKVTVSGRINWDILKIARLDYGLKHLRSYSLNSVSKEVLKGEQKIDLNYHLMNRLQDGSADDRSRIAEYCLRDCELPHGINNALTYDLRYIELARVTGTPIEWLVHRGQAIKCSLQIRREARPEGYVVPFHEASEGDKYEGAVVLEPIKNFYQDAVSTLDFNSLYPNIMRKWNLCYTTYKRTYPTEHLANEAGYITRHAFAEEKEHAGLLPRILGDLLDARSRAKAELKKTNDPLKRKVLDSRQLALKATANSGTFVGVGVAQRGRAQGRGPRFAGGTCCARLTRCVYR